MMLEAAELWALARRQGKPTATDQALDGDMILVAQSRAAARIFAAEADGGQVVIATMNARHLTPFSDARDWQSIV